MKDEGRWVHDLLDGDGGEGPPPGGTSVLSSYVAAVGLLERSEVAAPDGFAERVMAALPEEPDLGWHLKLLHLWRGRGRWLVPAAVGALAVLILAVGLWTVPAPVSEDLVSVSFEFHAPDAHTVDLVGSFNDWKPGATALNGPDASGFWTATIKLPRGSHEYLFLVDGREWIPDPQAPARRPDGFGQENGLLRI